MTRDNDSLGTNSVTGPVTVLLSSGAAGVAVYFGFGGHVMLASLSTFVAVLLGITSITSFVASIHYREIDLTKPTTNQS